MDSNILPKPELFLMSAPFQDMNGACVKVSGGKGDAIGTLICFQRKGGLFGVRIDIVYSPIMESGILPAMPGTWQNAGVVPVEYLCLSKGDIQAIERSNDEGVEFKFRRQ
jgi:hypothetical protein